MVADVITCRSCRRPLTRPVRRAPELPTPVPASPEDTGHLPTVAVGAWAVDPGPVGWDGDVPTSTLGCLVTNPSDALPLVASPDPVRNSGCCGHDGLDGPNLLCPGCGREVATLRDDCWSRVEVRFEPGAVVVVPVADAPAGTA